MPVLRAGVGKPTWPSNPEFRPQISGLSVRDHGGECCGAVHLFDFPMDRKDVTDDDRRGWLKDAIRRAVNLFDCNDDNRDTWEGCVEVCLTAYQCETWQKLLEEAGFKHVFEWTNDNTDNVCHMFCLATGQG